MILNDYPGLGISFGKHIEHGQISFVSGAVYCIGCNGIIRGTPSNVESSEEKVMEFLENAVLKSNIKTCPYCKINLKQTKGEFHD